MSHTLKYQILIIINIHVQYINNIQIQLMDTENVEKTEKVEKKEKTHGDPNSPEVRQKKERRKHEEKKPRHERNTEVWNPDLITEETVLEPLPKKSQILAQPKIDDVKKKQDQNRKKILNLIDKKKKIHAEKFKSTKPLVKGEGGKNSDFQIQVEQFKEIKERYHQLKRQRDLKRDSLTCAIQQAKKNHAQIKRLKDSQKNCKEYFEKQLQKSEHRLITAQLTKDEEKNLNQQIQNLKRKLKDAESVGNVQIKIARAEQERERLSSQIQKLKEQKQPLEAECKELRQKMDEKNAAIDKIKGEKKVEIQQKKQAKEQVNQEHEDWKNNKKKRMNDINKDIEKLEDQNQKVFKDFQARNDAYWEQKQKLDFLEWQHRVKERKLRQKKRAQMEVKQKEKEKQANLRKYLKEIELCEFLTNYLKEISQVEKQPVKQQQKTQQPVNVDSKLKEDSQWKKQKGLVVLQSKKSKQDEQPVAKKGKKTKKKGQKNEQATNGKKQKFEIPFNIQLLFDQLKVLAPESLEECQKKIQELKQREQLFERACNEDASQQDRQKVESIKGTTEKKQKKGQTSTKRQQSDFPTL